MKDFFKEILPYVVVIIIVILIKTYIVSPVKVNGDSMIDTLHNKDIMLLSKISYKLHDIERFDIVVVREGKDSIIKRVIGLPGEQVEYIDNKLYINGKVVKENFKHKDTDDFIPDHKIPADMYFVVGDNRGNSTDSRVLGYIPKQDILGKANFTIYPLNRIGIKK